MESEEKQRLSYFYSQAPLAELIIIRNELYGRANAAKKMTKSVFHGGVWDYDYEETPESKKIKGVADYFAEMIDNRINKTLLKN